MSSSQHTINITGVPGNWTQGVDPPTRLEINDLIRNKRAFSLYIQALQRMFTTPQTTPTSHFQIAGIHGLPYTEWNGSGDTKPVRGTGWPGYCTHGSTLFPTWHRPYIALYEQVLNAQAVAIASTYTVDKAAFQAEAAKLRAPFFDWARKSTPPPEVASLAQVSIIGPDGRTVAVNNPLLGYRFNPIDRSFYRPYNVWPTTLRHPTSGSASAQSNVRNMLADLAADQVDIRTKTYNLLTRVDSWAAMASHTVGDGGSSSNSLEAIHDGLHVSFGGGGHMSDPAVAAFDPIFWLHHCNVDRILALWQALHPNTYVSRGDAEDGTWTFAAEQPVDATSGLTPFYNSANSYWNSNQVRDWRVLGFTYPEFVGLNLNDKATVEDKIGDAVNMLYAGDSIFAAASSITSIFGAPAATHATSAADPLAKQLGSLSLDGNQHITGSGYGEHAQKPINHPSQACHPTTKKDDDETVIEDWAAHIQCKMYELDGSFSVLIFVGPVPEDASQWRQSPSYVGAHNIFANSAKDRCENCKKQLDVVSEGFVHLTEAIAKRSGLPSLDEDVVGPYLKTNLHWRVQMANREPVPTENLPSLDVDVVSLSLVKAPTHKFPHRRGDARSHHECTEGRKGGHRRRQ